MIQEFKDFIAQGGIFETAVGLVLALAFAPVITAIVDQIIMPIVAAIVGEPNFNGIGIDIGDARLGIGFVITAMVSFVAIAWVLFLLMKAYNRAVPKEEAAPAGPSETELLVEIRDLLRAQQ